MMFRLMATRRVLILLTALVGVLVYSGGSRRNHGPGRPNPRRSHRAPERYPGHEGRGCKRQCVSLLGPADLHRQRPDHWV